MATNSKGNILVYTRTGGAMATMGGSRSSRTAARGCSSSIARASIVREIGRACTASCSRRR